MNLDKLRIFHVVASRNSFSRASEDLCLTQPGISKHVKHLEDYYGLRLFDRLGKKVVLTQAGDILYESTQKIFRLIDDATEKIGDLKAMAGGKITVGASFTAGVYIIPELLGRFNQMYPDVEILLDIAFSRSIAEKVIANELDIGFIGAPYDDERLITKTLCDDRLVIIIPKDHQWKSRKSIKLAELADQPFIFAQEGSGTRTVIENLLRNADVKLRKKIDFGNTEAVKKAVAAGIGVSILSEFSIKSEVADGRIKTVRLSDYTLNRTFYFTCHKGKYKTNITRALINLITGSISQSTS